MMQTDKELEIDEEALGELERSRLRRLGGFSGRPSLVRLGKHERSIQKHVDYALRRVRAKSFKTPKHLAFTFAKPERWAILLRDYAIEQGKITLGEWQTCFRRRGRPKKGLRRGPYKKRREKDM